MPKVVNDKCSSCGKDFRRFLIYRTNSLSSAWKPNEGIRICGKSLCNNCWDKIFLKIIKEFEYIKDEEVITLK